MRTLRCRSTRVLAGAHFTRGNALYAISDNTGADRWEEAKAAYAKALEIDPTNEIRA